MAVTSAPATETAAPADEGTDAPSLAPFVFALFFIFGGITSLNDVLIPKLKELFTLSYSQAMLVQSAFFAAYLVVRIPGAALVKRLGYMRGAVAGPADDDGAAACCSSPPRRARPSACSCSRCSFSPAGITIVQVVANPLISLLGPPRTAHSRLTFAQAFNSLGTTVFPYLRLAPDPRRPRDGQRRAADAARRSMPIARPRRRPSSAPISALPLRWRWSRSPSGCSATG